MFGDGTYWPVAGRSDGMLVPIDDDDEEPAAPGGLFLLFLNGALRGEVKFVKLIFLV